MELNELHAGSEQNQKPERITREDVEASIAKEYYFTAGQGIERACGGPYPAPMNMVTICVMQLHNGHRIVGVNEGPVTAELFSETIGREYARKKATDQIWPLLGYELRTKLAAKA